MIPAYLRHRDEIAAMLDHRCHTIEWLDGELANGNALAFGNDKAVIVITVRQYPAGATELHGLAAAGKLSAVLSLVKDAEDWGRSHGLTFACISSRQAWSRVLKPRGYSVNQVSLRKDL